LEGWREDLQTLNMFVTELSMLLESRQCIVHLVSVKTILKYKEAAEAAEAAFF
jgi:hypothetical protein